MRRNWGVITKSSLALVIGAASALGPFTSPGQTFRLPTPNRALFETGGEPRFYAPTAGKTWTAGTFGCVRSEGAQFHEGIDILTVRRDARGEPLDTVTATADGTVCYVNRRGGLSNYGIYVVLRHVIEGLEIYSLYAHLADARAELEPGQPIRAGDPLGTLGRTANTRQPIGKERAHLHFELALLANDQFPAWFRQRRPGQRDDHGPWNGQNLLGFDPAEVLLRQRELGEHFSLLVWLRGQPVLCRVLVREDDLALLRRYPALVRRNPVAEKAGVAGHEVALNYAGVPLEIIPRASSEIKGTGRFQLLSVNEAEQRQRPCKRLVTRQGSGWQLARAGEDLFDLLAWR